MPVVVGGCPWRVPSVRRASRGSLVGPVKNDRNFSSGYACGAAAETPHRGPPGQKTGPPAQSVSNPCRRRVQSVSNCPASPVTASDLGPCVPAKTTGTQALAKVLMVRLYCFVSMCICFLTNKRIVCPFYLCTLALC